MCVCVCVCVCVYSGSGFSCQRLGGPKVFNPITKPPPTWETVPKMEKYPARNTACAS